MIRAPRRGLHGQSTPRRVDQSNSFRSSFSLFVCVERLNCKAERMTVHPAGDGGGATICLSGGSLRGLRSPALKRLAEQSVPRDLKSPIGNLKFQTHTALPPCVTFRHFSWPRIVSLSPPERKHSRAEAPLSRVTALREWRLWRDYMERSLYAAFGIIV